MASDFDQVGRVTSKGQVTIPVRVRRLLGIRDGDPVAFKVRGDTVILESARKPTLSELLAGFDPEKHRHGPAERPWDDAPIGRERI